MQLSQQTCLPGPAACRQDCMPTSPARTAAMISALSAQVDGSLADTWPPVLQGVQHLTMAGLGCKAAQDQETRQAVQSSRELEPCICTLQTPWDACASDTPALAHEPDLSMVVERRSRGQATWSMRTAAHSTWLLRHSNRGRRPVHRRTLDHKCHNRKAGLRTAFSQASGLTKGSQWVQEPEHPAGAALARAQA